MSDPGFGLEYREAGPWGPAGMYARRKDRQIVCDFCLAPDPVWTYPAAPMPIKGHPAIDESADDWAACERCHELLESHSIGALVEWGCQQQRINSPPGVRHGTEVRYPPLPIQRRVYRENILRFMDARRGPPWRHA